MVGDVKGKRDGVTVRVEGAAGGERHGAPAEKVAVMRNAPAQFPDELEKLVSSTTHLARERIGAAALITESNRRWDAEVDREIALINRCTETEGVKYVTSQTPRDALSVLLAWEEMSRLMVLGIRNGQMTLVQGTSVGETTADGKMIYHTHFTDLVGTDLRPRKEEGEITFEASLVKFDRITAEVVLKTVERILRDKMSPSSLPGERTWHLAENDVARLTSRFRPPTTRQS